MEKNERNTSKACPKYCSLQFYKSNLSLCLFVFVNLVIQVSLVILRYFQYKNSNFAEMLAHSAGVLLNFYMSIEILLILKRCLTWLDRVRIFRIILPISDFPSIHKFVGCYILILIFIHTIGHCANQFLVKQNSNNTHTLVELLLNRKFDRYREFPHNLTFPLGWAILLLFIFISIFSLAIVRRNCFELFIQTHRLYALVYILLILHAIKSFWKWFLVPAIFLTIEITLAFFQAKIEDYGLTYIKKVNLLPSSVIQLVIAKPKKFKFKAGDYIDIKIPVISSTEYHPFTISSAPENEEEIWLHIRKSGDWTKKLYNYFEKAPIMQNISEPLSYWSRFSSFLSVLKNSVSKHVNFNKRIEPQSDEVEPPIEISLEHRKSSLLYTYTELNQSVNIPLKLVGPYGSDNRHVFESEHVILIASGIGVTPFSSILQSLWHNHSVHTCSNCNHKSIGKIGVRRLKMIDFIWVNREYESFEWFLNLLAELKVQESMSAEKFIEIHLYMTNSENSPSNGTRILANILSSIPDNSMRSIVQEMFMNIRKGRPKWSNVLKEIKENSKYDNIGIFFCGNKNIGDILKAECLNLKLEYSQENF